MRTCNNGHKAMLELSKSELVFDIKNTAYIFADSYAKPDTEVGIIDKVLKNVFDIGEAGNMDKLARCLDSAVEDCMELLYRFTKVEMKGCGFESNEWEECAGSPTNDEENYYLSMMMPSGFPRTSIHTMAVYVHDYIVYQCLYEWMMIMFPDVADRFKVLAEEKMLKIKDVSNRSVKKARIRLHPF